MKRISKQNARPKINCGKNIFSMFSTFNIVVLFLALGLMSCIGQLISPTIHDLSVIQETNPRTMRMQIPTQTGVNYIAQFRSQFASGSWSPFTNFVGTGFSYPFSNAMTSASRRFYRVVVDPRPWIRGEPFSRDPYDGETVQLDVLATGMPPLSYQWYGPDGVLTNGGQVSGSTTANLVISNVDPSNEGNYWVSVTNLYGSTSSVPAGVRITLSQAPRILIDPQSQSFLVGQSVSLWSSASGAVPLTYKWFGPAGILSDGGRVNGSATTNLTVTNLELTDDGGYYMVVSNSFGTATSSIATVHVQPGIAPRITTDPLSQTVLAGETVNLQVVANGTPTLAYRWQGPSGTLSNGGRISGATTPNLSISNFQTGDNGDYFVVITNAFGTATSVTANVTAQ